MTPSKTISFLLLVVTLACATIVVPETSAPLPSAKVISTDSTAPALYTASVPAQNILPPNTFGVVDSTTLKGKVVFGYQGWFGCPGDGSQVNDWIHWYRGAANMGNLTVDFWPDVSELTEDELCPTGMIDTGGNPIYAFSSYNPLTVLRHFYWMAEYGIDGVELQRFATELTDPAREDIRNRVTANVKTAAETYGRFFYIQYDGVEKHTLGKIKQDWKYLVEAQITESPQYMRQNGLPVVGLYGLGFEGRDVTPGEALDLIKFFQENPEAKYRAHVKGGTPFFWRTLDRDSSSDRAWANVYRSFDIISPWAVGRTYDKSSADAFLAETIIPDLAETRALGIDYMPVIYPGFSWSNLFPGEPYNQFPRFGGSFYWKQAYNVINAGADMIYVAMFDEVDEGTAMFKLVETAEELPAGEVFVPLDVDGYNLPKDWYLRLGGMTGAMLRGEIPLSAEYPGLKELYADRDILLKLEINTGADWTNLEILNPEIVHKVEITAAEGEFTNRSAAANIIAMNQTLENARAGKTITLHVEIYIDETAVGDQLKMKLQKGSIGWATLKFYQRSNGADTLIREVSHYLVNGDTSGMNPLLFSVPLNNAP